MHAYLICSWLKMGISHILTLTFLSLLRFIWATFFASFSRDTISLLCGYEPWYQVVVSRQHLWHSGYKTRAFLCHCQWQLPRIGVCHWQGTNVGVEGHNSWHQLDIAGKLSNVYLHKVVKQQRAGLLVWESSLLLKRKLPTPFAVNVSCILTVEANNTMLGFAKIFFSKWIGWRQQPLKVF
jgi:hypothetical protein